VTTYNDAIAELSQYHGQNGGVLEGQTEVRQIESNLRSLVNYTGGTGTATSLTALGLSFDSTGKLTFRSSALNSASISDVSSFFGDGVQPGFILNAENILNSINDPVSGTLGATVTSISTQISNVSSEIDAAQQRISVLQTDLTARLSAADATIAELEQQANYFTSLFAVERQNSQNITAR
jgi:flagellar hook-associated protein 2